MNALIEAHGRRPEVALLHGFALHSGVWGSWLTELSRHAELSPVDLPGHGRCPWHSGIRDLADLARAIGGEIPPGAIVVGWSLGGMLALELARQRPGRLGGLVLLATTPRFVASEDWPQGIDPSVFEDFSRALANDYDRSIQDFLGLQVRGAANAPSTLRLLRAGLRSRPAPDRRALTVGLDILRQTDLRSALPAIDVPTLVITGQRDQLTRPGAGEALARALPAAQFHRIVGAGHAPFLSHPAAVLAEVAAFIEQLAARPCRTAQAGP